MVGTGPSSFHAGILLLAILLRAGSAGAGQLTFPLTVDHALLAAALEHHLGADATGDAVLWGTSHGCHSLVVRDLTVAPAAGRARVSGRGRARLGFSFLGLCLLPLSWDGYLETVARPEVGADWQLRLRDLDSTVFDAQRRRTAVASRLWDLVKQRMEDDLGTFTFDLAPPVDEARALLRLSVPPERAAPLLEALATLRPLSTRVDEEGVKVDVAIDLPPAEPTVAAPEPSLTPEEAERWRAALEPWDSFLVFVVKDLGLSQADPASRDELLEVLLTSRHELLTVLVSQPRPGVDPVRQLFLDAWDRLRTAVRRAALHGGLRDRALRYVTFLAAGDTLAALDTAGSSLGLEITADGLRRLARILEPDFAGDPLAYSEAPDPALRELFHFHDPEPGPSEPLPPPDAWWWTGGAAHAAEPTAADQLAAIGQRLDRWVPDPQDFDAYRGVVGELLALVTERTWQTNVIDGRYAALYRHLVHAVAWQESCWRQFVRENGRVTFLLSTTHDVGIMQVNRRVWRGFFDLRKLEWDAAYNAGAGAEILAQFLARYGTREAASQLENAARATYAAYNGGPAAFRRYRMKRVPRRQRAVDRAFWEKYQTMAAGRALDFVLCTRAWGVRSVSRLPATPRGAG